MTKTTRLLIAVLMVTGLAAGLGYLAAAEKANKKKKAAEAAAAKEEKKADSPELAAVKRTAEAFEKAFNKHDAKAVAAFWTEEGEFIGADGEPIKGRTAIEKSYAEFFKKHPKAIVEVKVETLKLLGRHTSLEEGSLKLTLPGQKEPSESNYSVLHVREDDGWKMASVREWLPDPADLVLKDVDWLVGEWVGKTDTGETRVSYAWDEDKVYLRGRYSAKKGDKVMYSGTQIIGKDPNGGLRSWQFDSNGSYGQWNWSRDEGKLVIETTGTLPDGSEETGVNIVVPLSKDEFTMQSVERTVAGSPLPETPPIKVTRVKSEK